MIVLRHCNKYYGPTIKGCAKQYLQRFIPPSLHGRPSFSIKVGFYDCDETANKKKNGWTVKDNGAPLFVGCCTNGSLRRLVDVTEANFLDIHSAAGDNWELFHAKYTGAAGHVKRQVRQYVLVPRQEEVPQQPQGTTTNNDQEDASVSVVQGDLAAWRGWTHVGTCRASALRMDLEYLMHQHLKNNNNTTTQKLPLPTCCCTHVEVFAHQLYDRNRKHFPRDTTATNKKPATKPLSPKAKPFKLQKKGKLSH